MKIHTKRMKILTMGLLELQVFLEDKNQFLNKEKKSYTLGYFVINRQESLYICGGKNSR